MYIARAHLYQPSVTCNTLYAKFSFEMHQNSILNKLKVYVVPYILYSNHLTIFLRLVTAY